MKQYFYPADVLLPKNSPEKWAVIACDQYTSEPEYWKETEKAAGEAPSALNIILPEVYLKADNSEKIEKINANMKKYLNGDVFRSIDNSYILTMRTLHDGRVRTGVVGLVNLEDYSYKAGADTAIRATEQTVIERIPPRVEIRKDATLEIPHIMLLIDDPEKTVIEPLKAADGDFEKLYDFTLMQNAGSIKGYRISDAAAEKMNKALGLLADKNNGFLFAVGDGNHSLATAKECYNSCGGSRYAMVEIVNIHDSSLQFEPIYRVLFGAEPEHIISSFVKYSSENRTNENHTYTCIYGDNQKEISVPSKQKLAVADLQKFIDGYIKEHPGVTTDYIHGEENLKKICRKEKAVGFLFGGMSKSELFPAVMADGSLPRKTFSMGHADDKRFYLEARKL